ncbi:hypothetical protein BS78_02G145000, partial [Paspalum vaginatum]
LHGLILDDLGRLLDVDADCAAEGLRERLHLGEVEGEELRSGHGREGRLRAQLLGDAHGERGLAGAGLACDELQILNNSCISGSF